MCALVVENYQYCQYIMGDVVLRRKGQGELIADVLNHFIMIASAGAGLGRKAKGASLSVFSKQHAGETVAFLRQMRVNGVRRFSLNALMGGVARP
jgi:hypothetical protein